MRLLLIDVNCKGSSTGNIVYDLYSEAKRNGIEAAICYGRGTVISEKNIYKCAIDLETCLHAFLTRVTGLTGYFSFFSTLRLIKFIKKFKPDVVHIHELHAYFINIKPLVKYLKTNNIKTIWTFHCEFMYTGKCGHAYDCERWMAECGHCPRKKDYPASMFFDFTKKMLIDKKQMMENFNNLTIVTPSIWMRDRIKNSFLKTKQVVVIYNGVNTKVFYPRNTADLRKKWGLDDRCKVVLTVAPDVMSVRKGGGYFLKLAKMMENDDYIFMLIGTNETKKISRNVIAIKEISNANELAEYYSMADLFFLGSKRETFSMTCAEALCCGTPIIGFRCGAPETIFKEPYAFFVEYSNIQEIAKLIKDFQYPEDTDKYGRKEFSKECEFENYYKYYRGEYEDCSYRFT